MEQSAGFAARSAISSARCILQVDERLWATAIASSVLPQGFQRIASDVPLFINAINELEHFITVKMEALERENDPAVRTPLEEMMNDTQPNANAIKKRVIDLGDVFEAVVEADDDSWLEQYHATLRTLPDENIEKVEDISSIIVKSLLALYHILYSGETGVSRDLKKVA